MNATITQEKAAYLLEFDPEDHIYYVNGERKISTTQVLKLSGVVDDRWYNEHVRWRGSEVHRVTAALDRGEPKVPGTAVEIEPRFLSYVTAWERFKIERKFRPVMIERMLYDAALDVCGTLDRVGFFEGNDQQINVLIDLKTSESGHIPKWVGLQTASYGHALDPKALWRRMAVILLPDGTYKVEPYPVDTYMKHVADFQTLVQSLRVLEEYGN